MKITIPEWFKCSENDLKVVIELYKTGYIYPLKERDENGRKTILIQLKRMDPDAFTSADAFKVSSLVYAVMMEDEESQIAGFNFIVDCADVTLRSMSLFSMTDLKNFVDSLKNSSVGRFKSFYILNLPTFAIYLFDIAKSTLTEKLRNRIVLPKDIEELKQHINPSILPKEFGGGDVTEVEMVELFGLEILKHQPQLEQLNEMSIDLNMLSKTNGKSSVEGTVGSFRKLDID